MTGAHSNERTQQKQSSVRGKNERRRLGAYYTPLSVSTLLARWGIRSKSDLVFEPCFGGCTFLEASVERFKVLNTTRPERNLSGCDIDPVAFEFLDSQLPVASKAGQFFEKDFLRLLPEELDSPVDFLVGNPPYISYENLDLVARAALDEWRRREKSTLHGRSSIWAYFVVHALKFIRPGGRLALVLPGSFLSAAYSQKLRDQIRQSFGNVLAISVSERLFVNEGTEETTVILLAENFMQVPEGVGFPVICVDKVSELEKILFSDDLFSLGMQIGAGGHPTAPTDVLKIIEQYSSSESVSELGELFEINIGLVTGNSKFFIKSREEWGRLGIGSRYLSYIVPRSLHVNGISLTAALAQRHIKENLPCLALRVPVGCRSKKVESYLNSYPAQDRISNVTFRKRERWYDFYDNRISSAFFVFMTDQGPRVIMNEAEAPSTNSYYRLFLRPNVPQVMAKLAAISLQSTLSQVSAEIVGHARGAGALKLEPSRARKILLQLPRKSANEIDQVFALVNKHVSACRYHLARSAADHFLFDDPKMNKDIAVLERGLQIIRARRNNFSAAELRK